VVAFTRGRERPGRTSHLPRRSLDRAGRRVADLQSARESRDTPRAESLFLPFTTVRSGADHSLPVPSASVRHSQRCVAQVRPQRYGWSRWRVTPCRRPASRPANDGRAAMCGSGSGPRWMHGRQQADSTCTATAPVTSLASRSSSTPVASRHGQGVDAPGLRTTPTPRSVGTGRPRQPVGRRLARRVAARASKTGDSQ
jgi:hypothetical protein